MSNVTGTDEVRKGDPPPDDSPLRTWLRAVFEELRAVRDALQNVSADGASSIRLLDREEAADRLNVSTRTLDTIEASGEIQAVRIRGRVLYHVDTLDAYINRAARGGDQR